MHAKNHIPAAAAVVLGLTSSVFGHAHHEHLTEEQRLAPVDSILWIHIFLQMAVWGILFPLGMVLGMARSRWHVPLQVCHLYACASARCLI